MELFLSDIEDRLRLCMLPEDIFLLVSLAGPGLPDLLKLVPILLAFWRFEIFLRTDGEASMLLSFATAFCGFCSMITGCWYFPTAFQCSRCALSDWRIFSLASALSANIWFNICTVWCKATGLSSPKSCSELTCRMKFLYKFFSSNSLPFICRNIWQARGIWQSPT